ncbi:F-box protein CPR1-like [Jatropha curcas]|uniref:F-box protein CPR1-like n=1 Tax=Jatropha curcas TaxID=180498 RepID=UPI00189460D5|nr:F-box protein CPR1-like [Jatropha curcas]
MGLMFENHIVIVEFVARLTSGLGGLKLTWALVPVRPMESDPENQRENLKGGAAMEIRVPEEIVGQIFSKLPAKSLLRFKCLSKSLNSLISSPNFIRSHVPRSQGDLPKYVCGSYFFDVNTAVEAKPVKINTPTLYSKDNEANALRMCVSWDFSSNNSVSSADFDSNYYSIIVWNPLIREYRIFPMPESGDYVSYGLGYDSVTDDYKVAGTFLHGALHWMAELANSGWVADFANSGKIIVALTWQMRK